MSSYVARCSVTSCNAIVYRGPADHEAIDAAYDAHLETNHPELLEPGIISGVSIYREKTL